MTKAFSHDDVMAWKCILYYWLFVREITSGFVSQGQRCEALVCFLMQAVEQTNNWPVIRDSMTPMWHHFNKMYFLGWIWLYFDSKFTFISTGPIDTGSGNFGARQQTSVDKVPWYIVLGSHLYLIIIDITCEIIFILFCTLGEYEFTKKPSMKPETPYKWGNLWTTVWSFSFMTLGKPVTNFFVKQFK